MAFADTILVATASVFATIAVIGIICGIIEVLTNTVGKPRAGHVIDDPACAYWQGDFAGVDLNAECRTCNPVREGAR